MRKVLVVSCLAVLAVLAFSPAAEAGGRFYFGFGLGGAYYAPYPYYPSYYYPTPYAYGPYYSPYYYYPYYPGPAISFYYGPYYAPGYRYGYRYRAYHPGPVYRYQGRGNPHYGPRRYDRPR